MENQISLEDLKVTYTVLKKIMEEEHLTKDTSFVRVRSVISNMICDEVTKEEFNNVLDNI